MFRLGELLLISASFLCPTSFPLRGKQPLWLAKVMQYHIQPAAQRVGIGKQIAWHTFRHRICWSSGGSSRRFGVTTAQLSPGEHQSPKHQCGDRDHITPTHECVSFGRERFGNNGGARLDASSDLIDRPPQRWLSAQTVARDIKILRRHRLRQHWRI